MTGVGYNQMERLIMLGTGNALVTRCYNTCFAIQDDDEYFLVDAGGGNGIMRQLQDADISLRIFVAIIRIIQIIPSKWSVCSWVKKM